MPQVWPMNIRKRVAQCAGWRAARGWGFAVLAALAMLLAHADGHAATYCQASSATYAWETASTNVTWENTSTSYPNDDDRQTVNIGFTFNYGGVNYTQLQIITNGLLHFGANQNMHQAFTNTTLPTGAYDRFIAPYWDDLNPLGNPTTQVRYSTLGSAPNRRFVVSWEGVPVFPNTGSYTFQVVLYENGDIKFQYGAGNANGASATIGLEVSSSDYNLFSFNASSVSNGTAILYSRRDAVCLLAEYRMDETTWGVVNDSTANGNHGVVTGTGVTATPTMPVPPNSAIAGGVGTCGAGNFPGGSAAINAVTTPVNPGANIGGRGSIAFWYASRVAWNAGGSDQMLFDASNDLGNNAADRYFFLAKQANGSLVFNLKDSAGANSVATTGANSFAANTWHHVAVAWDLAIDRIYIYIDGVLSATSTTNVNGILGNTNTLYIGDRRNTSGITATGLSANGTNGYIDEVRIYNRDLAAAEVSALMTLSRPCANLDHFSISHAVTGVACDAHTITITGHDPAHNPVSANGLTVNLSTSNARGTWTGIVAGGGVLSDPTPGDGAASYTFAAGSNSVQLQFRYANLAAASESFNFNVSGGGFSEATGTANITDDPVFTMSQAGFRFRNITDGNDVIPTQISGKPSDTGFNAKTVRIQAIRTDTVTGACTGLFASQTRTVDLGAECNNPATCAARQVSINGGNIATSNNNGGTGASAYTGVALNFNANSEADTVISYPDAGQISLHARYDLDAAVAGFEMIGSSNLFVVRPFGLAFPGIAHSNTATGALLAAAGDPFTMAVTAYQWASGEDANNDGIPDAGVNITDNGTVPNFAATATVSRSANLPGVALGTISRGPGCVNAPTVALSGGTATPTDWCYSEAGNVILTADVSNYISAGINITGNSGLDGAGSGGYVGRFRPKRFAVSAATIANRAVAACAPSSTFSYMDEAMTLAFTLTAQNAQGATTQNYTGAYARHDPTTGGSNNAKTAFDIGARNVSPFAGLTARVTGAYASSAPAWSNGVLNVTGPNAARVTVGRPTPDDPPDGPYTQVQFGIAATDSDGVLMSAYDLDADNSGGNERTAVAATTAVRYGRLRLAGVSGSQLLPLRVPVEAQYWNGTFWITNVDDNCTTLAAGNVGLGNYIGNLNAGETVPTVLNSPLQAGRSTIRLSAPGAGNNGSADLTLNLGAGANANACPALAPAATAGNTAYLRGKWCGATATRDPVARARFGINRGSDEAIYTRESTN